MAKVNPHFENLKQDYLFARIAEKAKGDDLIHLGIGDVALPLDPFISQAISDAADEMAQRPIGYGPAAGYPFLREALATHVEPDEVFVSSGAKEDLAALCNLFCSSATVGAIDPGYPVFNDINRLSGRKIHPLPCRESDGFIPQIPFANLDLIYLCSPGNPTGVAMMRSHLQEWVDYAIEHDAIILFDAAYDAFIESPDVPRSIYEIPNAKKVAIELKSFSKSHGFTGLRCAYTCVPKETGLHDMWKTYRNTTYNGCSYVVQRGALAALQTKPQIELYKQNAKRLKDAFKTYGGIDAPYLWWKTPHEMSSWEFFDHLLNEYKIVTTPGSGFGPHGEGYVRLSAFTTNADQAIERMQVYAH